MGTTTLNRALLVDTSLMGIKTDKFGTATGTTTGDFASATDVGKGVKLAANSYVELTAGDEIEGIVTSVDPHVKSGGYSWGGVQTTGRAIAIVGANQTSTIAVGGYVCSDTPVAVGTAGALQVLDTGTGYDAPEKFLWRVIRILSGTGVVGDSVLIERA